MGVRRCESNLVSMQQGFTRVYVCTEIYVYIQPYIMYICMCIVDYLLLALNLRPVRCESLAQLLAQRRQRHSFSSHCCLQLSCLYTFFL